MDVKFNSTKPLGHKSYGSIPHLPGSRLGIGDHHCHVGQAKIATERVRDRHDIVIIQEKLDGSNVGVAKINGEIIALTRSGYLATTSPYIQHHYFSMWVDQNRTRFDEVLKDGERICGEWLAQAHGTRYNLRHEPFVAFDLMSGNARYIHKAFYDRISGYFKLPHCVHYGGPLSVEQAINRLDDFGMHGALDPVEGVIYRVEHKGEVDFLTKYVRHDKQDGKYLPEQNGTGKPIWNVDVSQFINIR